MKAQDNSKDDKYYYWNPWHGCHKCSEGCLRCQVFERDKAVGVNTDIIKQNKTGFRLPIQKFRDKTKTLEKYELQYKIPSGSIIKVCETSDFFINEADTMRHEAWDFINRRQDCLFEIETKRPERIKQCLPDLWLDGWLNVIISVSVENTENAWSRIPQLLNINCKHKGLIIKPLLEQLDIRPFLSSGEIEIVKVGGESYVGWDGLARKLRLSWVRDIAEQCKEYDTPFEFISTGTRLELDNNQIVRIWRRDEEGLADFYKLDNLSEEWKATAEQLELQSLAQQAHQLYLRLQYEK